VTSALYFRAIATAAVAAFITSYIWYEVFGRALTTVSTAAAAASAQQPAPWKIGAELGRSFVLATIVAYLMSRMTVTGWADAVRVGFLLWLGLSAVQWAGSMLWEDVPFKMAAIHGGDWLVKLLLISIILAVWRK